MADELQRVGLVFKADGTVDFKKSLSEVNNSINENRAVFQLAKSEWNDSTSAMKKLQDRQEYLTAQTDDYRNKVEALTEILAAQESAEKRDEAAISKTRIQLDNARSSLNYYSSALEEVEENLKNGKAQLEEYANKVNEAAEKAENAGKKLSVVSAGIAATGAAAVKATMDMDDGYDTVITKTGATGEALDSLHGSMDKIFSDLPIEAETAGIAIGEVNTRFKLTNEALEELSEQFIQFAEINDTDLNSAIDNTDTLLKKFNLDGSEAGNVLGLLTKTGQDTGLSMDTLFATLMKNGSTLKEMGLGLSESVHLLASFEENGVDADVALAGLRKSIKKYTDEGKSTHQALAETIDQMKNAKTHTDALAAAQEVFGTKGAAEMTQAIKEGKFSLDELETSLSKYADTVTNTYQSTQDPWDQLTIEANKVKVAAGDLGEEIIDELVPICEELIEIIQSITSWYSSLDEDTKDMIVRCALIVAAIGPVILILSKVISGVGGLIGIVTKLTPVINAAKSGIGALNATLAANPIILIIGLIAGLIAWLVYLYNTNEDVRAGIDETFDDWKMGIQLIKDAINDFVENWSNGVDIIGDTVNGWVDTWETGVGVIKGNLNDAVDFVEDIVDDIKGFFDFEWSLPDIKLPHFDINGEFSLTPPSTPTIDIEWYAKGGILNNPTIFGARNGKLMGGGEAGEEAVLPIENLKAYIREINQETDRELINALIAAIGTLATSQESATEINLYLGDKLLSKELTKAVIREITMGQKNIKVMKGVAT